MSTHSQDQILVFASDIHGNPRALEAVLSAKAREGSETLVLLGDLLYHGPRNGVFAGYDPVACIELYNAEAQHILAVRGNCDSEVDQAVLNFPLRSDYAVIEAGVRFFLTHGHIFSPESPGPQQAGTVFVSGHTHLPVLESRQDLIFLNPGSPSLPKGGFAPTYAVWRNGQLAVKTLDGQVILSLDLFLR